ncbi:unnamed protein product [Brassica rapa subsp. trilocularis]
MGWALAELRAIWVFFAGSRKNEELSTTGFIFLVSSNGL